MYDELVKRLKYKAGWDESGILEEAAEAIEELSHDLDIVNEANIALHGALPMWIPVTEQLPIRGDSVLCFGDNGINVVDFICGDEWCVLPWFYLDGEQETGVTHWMYLPEPPEKEERTIAETMVSKRWNRRTTDV